MCVSRLYQVAAVPDGDRVLACDLEGRPWALSLLAYDGPPPGVGQWVVAHSGFALGPADDEDARLAGEAVRAAGERSGP